MKLHKLSILAASMALVASAASCSDNDDNTIAPLGAKTKITLSRYYNATGSTTAPVWTAESKGAVMIASEGKSTVSYASPIVPGSASSLFLFEVTAPRSAEATIIGFYPSDADVTCTAGKINFTVPTQQDGTTAPCLIGWEKCCLTDYEGANLTLQQAPATMYVNVARGNYSVNKIEITSTTPLAGNTAVNLADGTATADAQTVTVNLPSAINCSQASQAVAVMLAPVTLEDGYTLRITTTEGSIIEKNIEGPVVLTSGSKVESGVVSDPKERTIVFCGSDMVYMANPDLITGGNYKTGITWQWDAKSMASLLGLAENRCNHLDDCKPVDNGKKLLVTSSYHFAVLLDIETKQPLFYTNVSTNAHSAELLPGNKVAVACSDKGDCIQVYDISKPHTVLFSAPLASAHGVVWNNTTQRLYAIGGQTLNVYTLSGADTMEPKLTLEKSVQTPQSGLHDLTYVDANTLAVSGRRSYLYNVATGSFTEMTLFRNATALKSVNYNPETGECWYTDSTVPQGTQTWSTQTLHYTRDVNGTTDAATISVPDQDIYKIRVLNW